MKEDTNGDKERIELSAEAVMEASFDAVLVVSPSGCIRQVNSVCVSMFGYKEEDQLVGQPLSIFIGGGAADFHNDLFRNSNGKSITQATLDLVVNRMRDVTARRRDGTEFSVHVGIRVVKKKEQDATSAFLVHCHDLTRHKTQEASISEQAATATSQAQINQAMLDSAFDAIIVTKENGDIVDVNQAAVDMFGYETKEDMFNLNIAALVGGGHGDKHLSYMQAFQKRGGTSTVLGVQRELFGRRKDGTEFPTKIGVKKVPGSEHLMIGYVRDMTAENQARDLAIEKKAAEHLLLNMLPREIATRLQQNPSHIADHFSEATILFADIVGFTKMSNSLTPLQVVDFLNDIFSRFDKRLDFYGLNKIKTIGDCYMVTNIPGGGSGTSWDSAVSCAAVCHFALDMIEELRDYNAKRPDHPLDMRIGVNLGPVVAGVVGTKRFLYDIWGDAVNIASRMESSGVPGKVQVTQSVIDACSSSKLEFLFSKRGVVQVKGIGEMETFFLEGRDVGAAGQYRSRPLQRAESTLLEVLKSVDQLM